MSLNNYIGGKQDQYRPFSALGISIAGHIAAVIVLMHAPTAALKLPEPGKSEYKQVFEGKEQKLVWYKFNTALPSVAPPRARTNPDPLRAEVRARQQIVASPRSDTKRTQFVWTAAPELKTIQPLESP